MCPKPKPEEPPTLTQTTLQGTLHPTPRQKQQTRPPNPYEKAAKQLALSEAQGKLQNIVGLIYPTGPAKHHPAEELLLEFGHSGCPVKCGPQWSMNQLEAAVEYAAHPSAQEPFAAKCLRKETLEKVTQGFAEIVTWGDLRRDPPPTLKISPIAAIPHKTRHFRAILDLSFVLRHLRTKVTSVNEATTKLSHPQALDQLGQALPRLFQLLAWAPKEKGPILFQKLDIKDGYWRGVVEEAAKWNFCYVLPKLDSQEPTQLVVPKCLQMGWGESPAYFCTASETARDVGEQLTQLPIGTFPSHEMEEITMADYKNEMAQLPLTLPTYDNPEGPDWLPPNNLTTTKNFAHLIEVYIDDFIQAAQTTEERQLRHLSSALLHGIHSVFPPPKWTGHDGQNPIHEKKTRAEGTWETQKEILGWLLDGVTRCIALPETKVTNLKGLLTKLHKTTRQPTKQMETLRGKLQHATQGIPGATPLMGPFNKSIRHKTRWTAIPSEMKRAATDFEYVLRKVAKDPILARHIVPHLPDFCGTHDASGTGVGGVWFSGRRQLHPTVWQYEWPKEVKHQLISLANPHGTLTNSDLELAGAILHLLVLEAMVPMKDINTMLSCDNTPTVAWVQKRSCSSSKVATELLKVLGSLMIHLKFPAPQIHHIAGTENKHADFASRKFQITEPDGTARTITPLEFLTQFNTNFPLQNNSWRLFRLNYAAITRINSILLMRPCTMASWRQVTKKGNVFGTIGPSTADTLVWTPALPTLPPHSELPLWERSQQTLEADGIPPALVSECKRYRLHYAQSARPVNWTDTQTLATNSTNKSTSNRSNAY